VPPNKFGESALQQLICRFSTLSIIIQATEMQKELQRIPSILHFPIAAFRQLYHVVELSDE
jgi:hypothetical protein